MIIFKKEIGKINREISSESPQKTDGVGGRACVQCLLDEACSQLSHWCQQDLLHLPIGCGGDSVMPDDSEINNHTNGLTCLKKQFHNWACDAKGQ